MLHIKALEFKELFIKKIVDDELKNRLSNFVASNGWIRSFRKRFGIKSKVLHGESDSISTLKADEERNKLKCITYRYSVDDIFNADETGLFYRMMPNRTLAKRNDNSHGTKTSKERVSLLIMTNSTGSYKHKLLLIGKYKNPRCLHGVNFKNLPVDYKSNKNAWMDSNCFRCFLQEFDVKMRNQNRKVLLLLDNFSGHTTALNGTVLTNVNVHFIAPNLTSVLQPCDAGIIRSFKANYRKLFLLKSEKKFSANKAFNINIRNAIDIAADAWSKVTEATIVNCWKKTGIIESLEEQEINDSEEKSCLIELSYLMAARQNENDLDVEEYLRIEEVENHKISNEEIVDHIITENNIDSIPVKDIEDNEEKDNLVPKILITDGIKSLKYSLRFLEQQNIADQNDLNTIKILIQKAKEERLAQIVSVQYPITRFFK